MNISVKELGALAEYTLRPLLEDSNELLERLERQDITAKEMLRHVTVLYLCHSLINFATSILVTGAICYTILSLLRQSVQ